MVYRIGTRGSKLALAQAEYVRAKLAARYPEHEFVLTVIKTTGDRHVNVPMQAVGAKGIFIKELEEALLDGTIDLAVHSMKDMPAGLPEGLMLAGAWDREDPRDVLVLREKGTLEELSPGAVIATGSLRRKYQLLKLRPDLTVVGIRGNVETRLRKMEEQGLDGLVLAAAGLKRLHLEERITCFLDSRQMIPAPAQGALAIELAACRGDIRTLLRPFEDTDTMRSLSAERRFLALMGGGCHLPVGAIAEAVKADVAGAFCLRAMYGDETGERLAFASVSGTDPIAVAEEAARQVRKKLNEMEVGKAEQT